MTTPKNPHNLAGHDKPCDLIAIGITGSQAGMATVKTSEGHIIRVNSMLVWPID